MRSSCCQNGLRHVQPGSVWASPAYGPHGSRFIDGTSSSQALIRNVGTWLNAKGKDQVVTTMSLNTNDHARGGAVRSSDEKAVMALERRNCVIQSEKSDQPD